MSLKKYCILLLSCYFFQTIGSIDQHKAISYIEINNNGMIISQPGNYYLTGNVSFYPVNNPDATPIITIASSNVTLDCNRVTLTQSSDNTTLDLHGIVIQEGLDHIKIHNGTIDTISGVGIIIHQGCSEITIENMKLSNCVQGGILADGTANNPIIGSKFHTISCEHNHGDPANYGDETNRYSPCGGQFIYLEEFKIDNSQFIANQTSTNEQNAYGCLLQNCSQGIIRTSSFSCNKSLFDAYGLLMTESNYIDIQDCTFDNNKSIENNCYGCGIIASSHNTIQDCMLSGNHGYINTYGLLIQGTLIDDEYQGSDNNRILRTQSIGNYATTYNCFGFSSQGNKSNNFIASIAHNNQSGISSSSLAAGFYVGKLTLESIDYQESFLTIKECHAKTNYAQNGTGAGLYANIIHKAHIEENWLINNTGTNYSYGLIDLSESCNSLIMSNYAFGQSSNYHVTYADQNTLFPLITGTVGDFSIMANGVPFINYEWRNDCQCDDED